eukprot:6102918-Amphidinium_carterae.2
MRCVQCWSAVHVNTPLESQSQGIVPTPLTSSHWTQSQSGVNLIDKSCILCTVVDVILHSSLPCALVLCGIADHVGRQKCPPLLYPNGVWISPRCALLHWIDPSVYLRHTSAASFVWEVGWTTHCRTSARVNIRFHSSTWRSSTMMGLMRLSSSVSATSSSVAFGVSSTRSTWSISSVIHYDRQFFCLWPQAPHFPQYPAKLSAAFPPL